MNIAKSPFIPQRGVIRSIVPLAADTNLFEIAVDNDSLSNCQPGQFVELWIPGVGEAPISVCSGRVGRIIQLCIRKVGRVTSALFQMNEGDWVGLRGPFGKGFPLDDFSGRNVCLIAGGLGIAPVRSLWEYIIDHRESFGKVVLIYGLRHSEQMLFRQELKQLLRRKDMHAYIAAEEIVGPELPPVTMQVGRVTDMLRLAEIDQTFVAAVCGPPVMYKFVVDELQKKSVPVQNIWLSLERHMKCGIGKCGHCFVGGKFTCSSGPVFCLPELQLLPEAVECK